jgi:transposase-like protein
MAFLERPIEGAWPCLWIDATYVKVREQGRIVSTAVIVATGVNTDGGRELESAALKRQGDRPVRSGAFLGRLPAALHVA